jgi:hypothetical protein
MTQHCSAAFSGISLTDHFRDEFLNNRQTPALLGWSVGAGTESELRDTSLAHWRVHDGALEQTSTAPGEHIVLKGPILEQSSALGAGGGECWLHVWSQLIV